MRKQFIFVILASLTIAACGGGGGSSPNPPTAGGGGTVSTPTPSPTPTATPTPIANTSLPYYLPLGTGNTWSFSTGDKLVDEGQGTLQCYCPANGQTVEQVAWFPANSNQIFASAFFAQTGAVLSIVGMENDAYTNNIQIISNDLPHGFPIMDDNGQPGESWSDGTLISSIQSMNGTTTLNGEEIIHIANIQVTGLYLPTPITFSLAQGLGFTKLAYGGQSAALSSFSVSSSSYSVVRPTRVFKAMRGAWHMKKM